MRRLGAHGAAGQPPRCVSCALPSFQPHLTPVTTVLAATHAGRIQASEELKVHLDGAEGSAQEPNILPHGDDWKNHFRLFWGPGRLILKEASGYLTGPEATPTLMGKSHELRCPVPHSHGSPCTRGACSVLSSVPLDLIWRRSPPHPGDARG